MVKTLGAIATENSFNSSFMPLNMQDVNCFACRPNTYMHETSPENVKIVNRIPESIPPNQQNGPFQWFFQSPLCLLGLSLDFYQRQRDHLLHNIVTLCRIAVLRKEFRYHLTTPSSFWKGGFNRHNMNSRYPMIRCMDTYPWEDELPLWGGAFWFREVTWKVVLKLD